MDFTLSKKEKKLLNIVEQLVEKWRAVLRIDTLWKINVGVFDNDDMPDAPARVDISAAEYFYADLEVSLGALEMNEKDFVLKMNDVICHEITHILLIDFFRTAQLAAGENVAMQNELEYKYEQFTSRLQRAFSDLYLEKEKLMFIEYNLKELKEIWTADDYPNKTNDIDKKLKEIYNGLEME